MKMDTVVMSSEDFEKLQEKSPVLHRKSYYYKVEEYTIDGDFVRTWENTAEAAEALNTSTSVISHCCRGASLSVPKLGRIFLKEGGSIEDRLNEIEASQSLDANRKKLTRREVRQYDMKGKLVSVYPSLCFASDHLGISISLISNCMKGKTLYDPMERIFLGDTDSIKARLELIKQNNYQRKMSNSIDEYDRKGELVGHWKNPADISEEYNIPINKIIDCCDGIKKHILGRIFLYSKDSITDRLKLIKQKKK